MTYITTTLVGIECYKCHVLFGMTQEHEQYARDNGSSFFCPNGHSQAYVESEVRKLKRERDAARAEQRRVTQLASDRYDTIQHQDRMLAARKGVITRMKNRALAGGCVFCRRNFANVSKHMETKHHDELAARRDA